MTIIFTQNFEFAPPLLLHTILNFEPPSPPPPTHTFWRYVSLSFVLSPLKCDGLSQGNFLLWKLIFFNFVTFSYTHLMSSPVSLLCGIVPSDFWTSWTYLIILSLFSCLPYLCHLAVEYFLNFCCFFISLIIYLISKSCFWISEFLFLFHCWPFA